MSMAITPNDHVWDADSAKITLIECGDFECPYCARAHQSLVSLLPAYGDDVRLVYRHFPLTGMHPDARPAAEAAEAAHAEGKFREMHDARGGASKWQIGGARRAGCRRRQQGRRASHSHVFHQRRCVRRRLG